MAARFASSSDETGERALAHWISVGQVQDLFVNASSWTIKNLCSCLSVTSIHSNVIVFRCVNVVKLFVPLSLSMCFADLFHIRWIY